MKTIDLKRRSHKRNRYFASDYVDLTFTRSYHCVFDYSDYYFVASEYKPKSSL